MKRIYSVLNAVLLVCSAVSFLSAENAGSRGSFTRGGWAGARYAASGMTGEVMADDVFAIYWNPAGLTELKAKKLLTEKQITEKAKSGDIGDITEEDLLNFSESNYKKLFFDVGASYTRLAVERDAAFAGCAFNLFGGVFGMGLYSIVSSGIETRDDSGNLTGEEDYVGSSGFISYAIDSDIFSIGFSFKPLYEKIGQSTYAGAGADVGIQVSVLPFLKAGIMARDLGSFLKPLDAENSEDRYDFFKPQVRTGLLFSTDSGIKFSLSGSKKLEQTGFGFGIGVEYDLVRNISLNAGLDDSYFSTGAVIRLMRIDVAYALTFDRIDYGYNNTVSVEILF